MSISQLTVRTPAIDGSEPMQNGQAFFFSDIFLKIYDFIKNIIL
jgi:hypothetical protein